MKPVLTASTAILLAMVFVSPAAAQLGIGGVSNNPQVGLGATNPQLITPGMSVPPPGPSQQQLYPSLPAAPPSGVQSPVSQQAGASMPAQGQTPYIVSSPTNPIAAGNIGLKMRGKRLETLSKKKPKNQSSPGFATFEYDPSKIMEFTLRQNKPATIILPPWERIPTQSAIVPGVVYLETRIMSPNSMEVRSGVYDYDTTLKIWGASGNIYIFNIIVVPYNEDDEVPAIAVNVTAQPPLHLVASPAAMQPGLPSPVSPTTQLTPQPPARTEEPMPPELQTIASNLRPGLRAAIDNPSEIKIPHLIYEQHAGDAAMIAPLRVVETKYLTIFDFGPDAATRPAPSINLLQQGSGRDILGLYTLPDYPEIVVADKIGSFVMRWEDRVICIIRTDDPVAGLRPQPPQPTTHPLSGSAPSFASGL